MQASHVKTILLSTALAAGFGACKKKAQSDLESFEALQNGSMTTRTCGISAKENEQNPELALYALFKAAPPGLQKEFNPKTSFVLKPTAEVQKECKRLYDATLAKERKPGAPQVLSQVKVTDAMRQDMFDGCWESNEDADKRWHPQIWLINDSPHNQKIYQYGLYLMTRAVSEFYIDHLLADEVATLRKTNADPQKLAMQSHILETFVSQRKALVLALLTDLKGDTEALKRYKENFGTDNPQELAAMPWVQNFVLGQTVDAYYCTPFSAFDISDQNAKAPFRTLMQQFQPFVERWGPAWFR